MGSVVIAHVGWLSCDVFLGDNITVWTTEEQKKWLEDRKPAHTAAHTKGSNALAEFWKNMYEGWLTLWPLEDPTEKEKGEGIDTEKKMAGFKKVSG